MEPAGTFERLTIAIALAAVIISLAAVIATMLEKRMGRVAAARKLTGGVGEAASSSGLTGDIARRHREKGSTR